MYFAQAMSAAGNNLVDLPPNVFITLVFRNACDSSGPLDRTQQRTAPSRSSFWYSAARYAIARDIVRIVYTGSAPATPRQLRPSGPELRVRNGS
jgi:hypothetical protein